EAQRIEDLGGQDFANLFAGGRVDDLAYQRTPGQRVIHVEQPGAVNRPQFAELLLRVLVVVGALDVRPRTGRERQPGAVRHHVPDGDPVLAVTGEARQVVADPVVEREDAALDEHVHHGRRHPLGRRVDAERGVGRDGDLLGTGRVTRGVAPAVADRAVEHDAAVPAHAHLDGRMEAGPIPMPRCLPDPVYGGAVDFGVVFRPDRRHRVQVGGYADLAVWGGHPSEGTCLTRL